MIDEIALIVRRIPTTPVNVSGAVIGWPSSVSPAPVGFDANVTCTVRGRTSLDVSRLVVDEITLVGSRCGPFAPAIALLAEGRVDVRPLVHARFPLHEAVAAFAEASRPGVMKVLVETG